MFANIRQLRKYFNLFESLLDSNLLEEVAIGGIKLVVAALTNFFLFSIDGSCFASNFEDSYAKDAYNSLWIIRPLGEVGASVECKIIRYVCFEHIWIIVKTGL